MYDRPVPRQWPWISRRRRAPRSPAGLGSNSVHESNHGNLQIGRSRVRILSAPSHGAVAQR